MLLACFESDEQSRDLSLIPLRDIRADQPGYQYRDVKLSEYRLHISEHPGDRRDWRNSIRNKSDPDLAISRNSRRTDLASAGDALRKSISVACTMIVCAVDHPPTELLLAGNRCPCLRRLVDRTS